MQASSPAGRPSLPSQGVTWVDMRQQACLAWAASCAVLSSVRLEWTLSAWEEEVRGKPTTPLAALAAAPRLQVRLWDGVCEGHGMCAVR